MPYDELIKRLRNRRICIQQSGSLDDFPLLAEAADAIEQLSKPRWIPVAERLPEDGADILAVQSYCGEVRIVPANYDRGVWYDCVFNRVAEHITHWMPLPSPPAEE